MSGGISEQVNLDYTSPWWGQSRGSWHTVQPGRARAWVQHARQGEGEKNKLMSQKHKYEMNQWTVCIWRTCGWGKFPDLFGAVWLTSSQDSGWSTPGRSQLSLRCCCVVSADSSGSMSDVLSALGQAVRSSISVVCSILLSLNPDLSPSHGKTPPQPDAAPPRVTIRGCFRCFQASFAEQSFPSGYSTVTIRLV